MSELLALFGGTGAILIAVGGFMYKCLKSYEYEFIWEPSNINKPIKTLIYSWEEPGIESDQKLFENNHL